MKSLILIVLFIIILVCINWLSNGMAQVTSEEAKAYETYLKLKKNQSSPPASPGYTSPPIFEADSSLTDSLQMLNEAPEVESSDKELTGRTDATAPARGRESEALPQFGHDLFRNPQVGEINNAAIPENYLLGPGDNIIISLWGRVQQEWNLTVDREGKVFIPKIGEINAWGLTLADFEQRLEHSLAKAYTGYEKRVTLGKIRTIRVFVYGAVPSPGGYAVSALSTLFSALYMAGGGADNGSLRHIKLVRDHKTTAVDLYDFLIRGDKTCDVALQSGDVIFVPLVGPQAAIQGEVKRPGIYELKGGEKISDLLALAGGPTAEAYLGRLMLDRVSQDDSRKVIDLNFSGSTTDDILIVDGDDLSVFSIYQMRHNVVWVTGMIKHPGTFERTDGMKVSDLMMRGQLLPNKVHQERADLFRHHPDGAVEIIPIRLKSLSAGDPALDMPLMDLDSLHIYSTDEVDRKKYVHIDGLVRNPGRYPLYEGMNIGDLIFLAGNFSASAYTLDGELARIDSLGATSVMSVPLAGTAAGQKLPLQEDDHLFVRRIPGYQLHRLVTIEGEVRFPGKYSLSGNNETLWQLLNRAGGFTEQAFPEGMVFKRRAIVADLARKNIQGILEKSIPLVADSLGAFHPSQPVKLDQENTDRIIIDADRLLATEGKQGDFHLQAGDSIYIPEIPSGVPVLGEVCAKGTIKYELGKKVSYYLDQAGGFTKRADKKEVRLVKANGRVFASGDARGKKVTIGDVIIVPSEIKKDHDWLKFVSTSLSILTGVATTALIVGKL